MAKGQKRSNREIKKPKKDKAKAAGPATSLGATKAKSNPAVGTGAKK